MIARCALLAAAFVLALGATQPAFAAGRVHRGHPGFAARRRGHDHDRARVPDALSVGFRHAGRHIARSSCGAARGLPSARSRRGHRIGALSADERPAGAPRRGGIRVARFGRQPAACFASMRPVDYRVAQRGDLRTLELRVRTIGAAPPVSAESVPSARRARHAGRPSRCAADCRAHGSCAAHRHACAYPPQTRTT